AGVGVGPGPRHVVSRERESMSALTCPDEPLAAHEEHALAGRLARARTAYARAVLSCHHTLSCLRSLVAATARGRGKAADLAGGILSPLPAFANRAALRRPRAAALAARIRPELLQLLADDLTRRLAAADARRGHVPARLPALIAARRRA